MTFRHRPFAWISAGALLAAIAPPAWPDIAVVSNANGGGAVAVARTSTQAGNGVINKTVFNQVINVTDLDQRAERSAEFGDTRSTGFMTHRTVVSKDVDTLTFTSTALCAGTRTLTGNRAADESSSGLGQTSFTLVVTPTQRSTFVLRGFISVSSVEECGAYVTDPGTGRFALGKISLESPSPGTSLTFTSTGIIEANASGAFNLGLTGATARDTTSGRAEWEVSLTISPAGPAPEVFRWTRPQGGAFSTAANWNPAIVPVADATHHATAIFPLAASYAVDVGTRHTDRVVIDRSRVAFQNAFLTSDGTGPDPSFVVTHGGSLALASGILVTRDSFLGLDAGSAGAVVVDASGLWSVLGTLAVGAGGDGRLTLTAGGTVSSAESLVGVGGSGEVTVEDAPTKWITHNVSIGFSSPGSFTVRNGGTVESGEAFVAFGSSGNDSSNVVVEGTDSFGVSSTWTAQELTVGRRGVGFLTVRDGANVDVAGIVRIGTQPGGFGSATATGSAGVPSSQSRLRAGSLLLIGDGTFAEANVYDGGLMTASEVRIGLNGGTGTVRVGGLDPQIPANHSLFGTLGGNLIVGDVDGRGYLFINPSGNVDCSSAFVGFSGVGDVKLAGVAADVEATKLSVTTDLFVGGTDSDGWLQIDDAVVVVNGDAQVGAHGGIGGVNGKLRVAGTVFVDAGGFLRASLRTGNQVVIAKKPAPAPSPAVLTIEGDLDAAGAVVAEISGTVSRTQFAGLVVTGDANLGGKLVLQFMNGYAPRQGDQFDVLQVNGAKTGDFAVVEVRGLEPGAQFQTAFTGGALAATAMNDAVALPTVSIKAIGKKLTEKKRKAGGFTVSRTGRTASPLTVDLAIGGSAENGIDYIRVRETVTIPARKRSVKVKVAPLRDPDLESPETVEIEVVAGAGHTHSLKSRASLTIADR